MASQGEIGSGQNEGGRWDGIFWANSLRTLAMKSELVIIFLHEGFQEGLDR